MEAVTNVSCVVDNWSTMTCSWPWEVGSPSASDVILARLNYGTNGVPNQDCVDDKVPGSCHWPAENFKMGSLYTIMVTVMTLTSRGIVKGSEVSERFQFDTNVIVRPPAVTDISATNLNKTCASLSWQQVDNHSLKCRMLYNCSSWQDYCQPVDNVSNGSVSVCGLLPGTVYQWNVSCLPEEGGFWSEVSTFRHTTQTDVPASQPEVHPGSFLQLDCEEDNCREILLFWKAVPAHLRNGPITEYHIFVGDTDIGNETDFTVTNKTQTSLELRLEPNNTYQVQTSACTEMGCSTKSKHITIAPQGKGVSPPQDFTVEFMTDEEPGNFNINWQPLHTRVVSYTIYWCMREENTTSCTTPLDWTTVAPNTTEYNLTLPGLSENTTQDYTVGISAEAIMTSSRTRRASDASQVTSSGISWSQCLHISGNVPTAAPEVLHMTSDPSTASIDMEWQKLSCLETPSVLTGVLVVYCVVDGGDTCTGSEQSQMVIGRGSSYTLKDLDTGHTYLIKVCGVSAAGNGPFSAPVKVDLKAYLALMYTVLIVASVLLLLLFIFFCVIWGCCKGRKSDKLEISVQDDKLLPQEHDYVDMPTTRPESSTSAKNGTYRKSGSDKERDVDKELEDTKLLPSESYKENANLRWSDSLGPKRTDTCYMASSAKKNSRLLELKAENNNRKKAGWTELEDASDLPYAVVDLDVEGVPRERISSFKSRLPVRDYGFPLKDDSEYQDYVNAQRDRNSATSPLITDPKENMKSGSHESKQKPQKDKKNKQKRGSTGSFHLQPDFVLPDPPPDPNENDRSPPPYFPPPPANLENFTFPPEPQNIQPLKQYSPPPPSQNHPPPPRVLYAPTTVPIPDNTDKISPQNLKKVPPPPKVRYSSTSTAPLQNNRASTHSQEPPPPPNLDSLPRPASVRNSGTFPPVQTGAQTSKATTEEQNPPPPPNLGSLPRPASVRNPVSAVPIQNKETTDPQDPSPNLKNEPIPQETNSPITAAATQTNQEPKEEKPIPRPLTITPVQIPKPRTSLQSPKPFTPYNPEQVTQKPVRDIVDGRIQNEPTLKHEPEPIRTNVTPESTKPDDKPSNDKKPSQPSSEIPSNRGSVDKSTQENLPPLPTQSSMLPSAKPRTSSKTDEDNNVLDISFLVGELLGEGVVTKKDPDSTEVTMRPKKPARESTKPASDARDSKRKSNPPKVAPKPMFVSTRNSNYGRVEASPTAVSPPPTLLNRTSTGSSNYEQHM
ncbi:uncharacterized protein LOC124286521 [Haliotis rubra]|uniref:uncharacterized protein LOC124286521 n=1 Tax=Haliotis rubra TaxID=36100 RepID=UPI001EE5E355|nr:uncharacterized protein LOC124286521 [Haliotis rubra]XP_046578848.1 uncharacterized protein LOC124286521 [Haliotis rubra]XP_046578849.1 uncharacterized protein LOC124286521 [Haliotis rubra]